MSAYLVSTESISTMVKSILHHAEFRGDHHSDNAIKKTLQKYHNEGIAKNIDGHNWLDTDGSEFEQRLYDLLLNINLLSLGCRYGEDQTKDWTTEPDRYKYDNKAPVVKIPALINLIDNWMYQACEGVASETDFYKLMQDIKSKLALAYIDQQQKDKKTYWGIDSYEELKNNDLIVNYGAVNISRMIKTSHANL